jgi:hypothetical protein
MNIARIEEVSASGEVKARYATLTDKATQEMAALLHETERFISRFLVLPKFTLLPLSLWVLGTHLYNIFDSYAYLVITSATPRCGKTRVLEVLYLLCANPERTSNISEAALFRLIQRLQPTLFLDEMEQIRERGERAQIVRNLLNAGNRRDAIAIRCGEAGKTIERYRVYCPKALAAIGSLPDTISDRSIQIHMQRRTSDEKIERFLFRRAKSQARKIRKQIAVWTKQQHHTVHDTYSRAPDLDFLEDRDAESWGPLFSILAVVDPTRLTELRNCAQTLCGQKRDDAADEHLAVHLILDVDAVLHDDERHISSADLLSRLREIEDSPWSDPAFDTRQLTKKLRTFGLKTKPVRLGDATPRRYVVVEIREHTRRYKAASPATAATRKEHKDL